MEVSFLTGHSSFCMPALLLATHPVWGWGPLPWDGSVLLVLLLLLLTIEILIVVTGVVVHVVHVLVRALVVEGWLTRRGRTRGSAPETVHIPR